MRPSQLIPLYAVSTLAHTPGSHDTHVGICGPRGPIGLPSLLSNEYPICRPNLPPTNYLISQDQDQISPSDCHANCTDHHQQQHTWTHTSPCFSSKRSDRTYCVFSDATFADNRGTSIITSPKRAAHMATNPAFTDADVTKGTNQDLVRTKPAKYKMERIEGKGMGVIATGFIKRGELIMANTPSLMIDYGAFDDLEKEEYLELQAKAVEALPEGHREMFMKLSTHDEEGNFSYLELVERVVNTNAFDIDPDEEDEEQEHGFYVIFPEIARMNHDCRPNADYYYDEGRLTQWIHAVRDIYPGEEVTISYINPLQSQARREARLHRTWGFRCSCPACTGSGAAVAASDERVRQAEELVGELKDYGVGSRATPEMAELVVGLYEQERLWGTLYEAYAYAAIEWNGVGEPWTASRYARLAVEYGIYSVGEGDVDVSEMIALARDPWKHWSWMLRTRKRMGWGRAKESVDIEDE